MALQNTKAQESICIPTTITNGSKHIKNAIVYTTEIKKNYTSMILRDTLCMYLKDHHSMIAYQLLAKYLRMYHGSC